MTTYKNLSKVIVLALGFFFVFETMSLSTASHKTVWADTVEARRSAPVLSGPGESNRLVTRVKAGSTMAILGRQGRWLKVRVKGRIGWIARSNVLTASAPKTRKPKKSFVKGRKKKRNKNAAPKDRVGKSATQDLKPLEDDSDSDVIDDSDLIEDFKNDDSDLIEEAPAPSRARKTRTQSKKRKLLARDVGVKKDALLRANPNGSARRVGFVDRGESVDVLKRNGNWVLVRAGDDGNGWIERKHLGDMGGPTTGYNGWGLGVNVGYQGMGQQFASDGVGELANYATSSASIAAGVEASLRHKVGNSLALSIDVLYRFAQSTPGIRAEVGGLKSDIGYKRHELNGHLGVGYIFSHGKKAAFFGTVGYLNNLFNVSNKEDPTINIANLPSEVLAGPLFGLKLDIPNLTEKISMQASFDYLGLFAAKRAQTKGLEDGLNEESKALLAGVRLGYRLGGSKLVSLAYGFESSSAQWSGQVVNSLRSHNANNSQRDDVFHSVTIGFGIAK